MFKFIGKSMWLINSMELLCEVKGKIRGQYIIIVFLYLLWKGI